MVSKPLSIAFWVLLAVAVLAYTVHSLGIVYARFGAVGVLLIIVAVELIDTLRKRRK